MKRINERVYNAMTKEVEKELNMIMDFIINDLNINILDKCRNRLYPEYRSLFNTIAMRKYKIKPTQLARFFTKRGLKYSHDKVLHSFSKFEEYSANLPELKTYFGMFFKEAIKNKETVFIRKNKLTPLQELTSNLTPEQEAEIYEMVNLRIKSWSWKSRDKITVYTNHGVECN